MVPNNIVWGGNSFQTVPTIGPSPTRTHTEISPTTQPSQTATQLQTTATNTMVIVPSVTNNLGIILESTSTPHPLETQPVERIVQTETLEITSEGSQTAPTLLSASNEPNTEDLQEDQIVQNDNTAIPAFVFPLVVVLLLVIIYLVTRLSMKKTGDGNPDEKQ